MKSIGRCRCVSKLWASTLRLPYFTELFNIRSSARPHLLFVYREKGKFLFLSSPQPQNSSPVAVKHLSRISFGGYQYHCEISGPVHGLVCLTDKEFIERSEMSIVHIICNPSTGQTLTLPKVKKTRMVEVRTMLETMSFLGYDPIYKRFKVLSSRYDFDRCITEHQLLTLGTEKIEWRIIQCCVPHYCWLKGICINGVLYYKAKNYRTRTSIIVCFHVMSEKFSCIELDTTFKKAVFNQSMINYNGKLGSVKINRFKLGGTHSIELMVIGDSEKLEWSKHTYILPSVLKNVVGKDVLRFAGVTDSNEIVFGHPSCVIYYNIEKNTIVKVRIQGMEAFQSTNLSTFLDHKEVDPKLMEAF